MIIIVCCVVGAVILIGAVSVFVVVILKKANEPKPKSVIVLRPNSKEAEDYKD